MPGLPGPPAVRFGRSPRGGCVVVGGVSAAPGGAGSPWPALARPRLGGCNWLAGGPPAPRRQGWARPPFRGPRCGSLWPGPVPPPFRPALLRSRRATVIEGSALPGARGFRRLRAAGNGPGAKPPGEECGDCKRKTPLMGFFRNDLPFRVFRQSLFSSIVRQFPPKGNPHNAQMCRPGGREFFPGLQWPPLSATVKQNCQSIQGGTSHDQAGNL